MFTAVQFIFGIGVGGEYAVASTSANERAESSAKLSKRRGETVVLVFSMQGWGNLVNTAVIIGERLAGGGGLSNGARSTSYIARFAPHHLSPYVPAEHSPSGASRHQCLEFKCIPFLLLLRCSDYGWFQPI